MNSHHFVFFYFSKETNKKPLPCEFVFLFVFKLEKYSSQAFYYPVECILQEILKNYQYINLNMYYYVLLCVILAQLCHQATESTYQ